MEAIGAIVWLDPATNVLVYDTPEFKERILAAVPGAKSLSNGYVGMPFTLHAAQMLRWIGLRVPPPIRNYDWPRSAKIPKPFESQIITANFLVAHPRAFVFSDMGVGKTLAALWAADYVMQQTPLRALIVAPLSTLQRVWADAIFQNFLGRRNCVVVYGAAQKRRELLAKPADFYILNYDGINVVRDALAQRPDIRMVIIDEASAYRDIGTGRHKLARKLIAPRDYLWLMTGTPTPNGPVDAYGLAKLVNNAFGESKTNFHNRTMAQIRQWVWVPRPGAHAAAHKLMQPSIRFAIEDCVDLPPCTTQSRDVELSPDQAKAYRELKRHLQLTMKDGRPITAVNEAVLRLKLIQIACGAIYGTGGSGADRTVHLVDCGPRIRALREVMETCPAKIIIFAPLTSVIHMLHKELKKGYSCAIINGEVSSKERSELFRAFQDDPNPRVLIADPGTMAHGLTLTAASAIIWYAPTDKTELYLQANKRIDRPGQTRSTTIVHLAATPVEREIYRRLAANETMQGLILALAKGKIDGV